MANWNDPQPTKTGFGASPGFTGAVAGREVLAVGAHRDRGDPIGVFLDGIELGAVGEHHRRTVCKIFDGDHRRQ